MSRVRNLKRLTLSGLFLILLAAAPCDAQDAFTPDEQALITSYNTTALQLYRELHQGSNNLVISPISIGIAMSMALAGARGETEREMARVLNQPLRRERMSAANANVLDRLRRERKKGKVELSVANALCLAQHGDAVHQSYRDLLHTKFVADIFSVKDSAPINAWVSKETHGKIDEILTSLDPDAVCVLLSAVYFKGRWADEFDEERTSPGEFYTMEGETLSVPMMHQGTPYSLVKYEEFAALALPYEAESFAMIVLLPNQTMGLAAVEERLSIDLVQSVLGDLEKSKPRQVDLSLPKFKMESSANLIPSFHALGMRSPFLFSEADFGGIAGQESAKGLMWITDIRHKAFIEVNEKGTEAAAATSVSISLTGTRLPPQFRVDHPFLFFLVDRSTNAILFMGRVMNPLQP
jgi:serpin B